MFGSRIRAAGALIAGNPQPWRRERLFGNRITWAIRTVRAWREDRHMRRSANYVASVAGATGAGAAAEIERAKKLLESGAISQDEFEAIRRSARLS